MIEIVDTTLRDGEQTSGISFNPEEKLAIAHLLLEELNVDRIEVVSARVSSGESLAFSKICAWAKDNGYLDRVEALGFLDGGESVDWIADNGGKVINILSKGSLNHLEKQLRKSPQQHIDDICDVIRRAVARGMSCNLYLEDWSNGMFHSPEYVFQLVDALKDKGIGRFILPDTLGVLNPVNSFELCTKMRERYPDLRLEFHAHNDYGMAVANSMMAVKAGFNGVHVTVNGLGERCGNASLAPVVASVNDHTDNRCAVRESGLVYVCNYVASICSTRIPANAPIVGDNAFTQSAGVHADGDSKGNLYFNNLLPQRFGRSRTYALGKLSGKSNIAKNLEMLGIKLKPEQIKQVTKRVVELGDKKESLTSADLPFIVADVLRDSSSILKEGVVVENYSMQLTKDMKPVAILKIKIHGMEFEVTSSGNGQYNAFMNALWSIYEKQGWKHPTLQDYNVGIPPGGKTDALVSTTITWEFGDRRFKTSGIDSDQTVAAVKATLKMLNFFENLLNDTENCKTAR